MPEVLAFSGERCADLAYAFVLGMSDPLVEGLAVVSLDERYLAPSFEEPVTLDEEREYAWHELPACDVCHGEGELWVPPLGLGVSEEWIACRECGGEGYVDPRSQT